MNAVLANNIAQGQAQRDVSVDDRAEQQWPSTEVDYHGGPLSEVFGPPESVEHQRATTEIDCHGGPVSEVSGPRRQPHRWQEGGSLYRHATSDGCTHLAGPFHRQPPLSRTRYLSSGFSRTI